MLPPIEQLLPNDGHWQQLCKMLKAKVTLTTLVLSAWQMGVAERLWNNNSQNALKLLRRGPILSAAQLNRLCETAYPH